MAITTIKVHPGIGIARVGNSPDEFFIGPETADEPSIPQNGYKDSQCRVKRQGARFRLYSYDENGDLLDEITSAEATIRWKVELANRKASGLKFQGSGDRNPSVTGSDRDKLDITPGEKEIEGPNQVLDIDGQFEVPGYSPLPVHLGQLRTDTEGRLVVLGGRGKSDSPVTSTIGSWSDNDTWYDDVSDGRVKATVTLTASGDTFEAVAGWVVVAPPKFAPPIYNPITMYDTLFQLFRDTPSTHRAHVDLPPSASFRKDIFPILESGRDSHGVYDVGGAHAASIDRSQYPLTSMQRAYLMEWIRAPGGGGSMPKLAQSPPVTQTQWDQLQRWASDTNFVNDWDPGLPPTPITPESLDRGPLTHSCGAPFFPGIEGGAFFISSADIYLEPFRFDPAIVSPGDVTRRMALPWQADFNACGGNAPATPWWPVPRPLDVHPQSSPNGYEAWDDNIGGLTEMVAKWSEAGFVVRSGNNLLLGEKCAELSIVLLTPVLDFGDVQQNPMNQPGQMALAVTFEVLAPSGTVTFDFVGNPSNSSFSKLTMSPVTAGPTSSSTPTKARLWVKFMTNSLGALSTGTVVVTETGSGQQWIIDLRAKTVARQTTAIAMILDRSGSMSEPSGVSTKIEGLRQAANIFVNTGLTDDGIGVVSYNSNAQPHGTQVSKLDALGGIGGPRDTLSGVINSLTPTGGTSIGDGLEAGTAMLNASSGYDRKAMVVFTDGKETASKYIADVAGLVKSTTFAIGLGEPANINASTLATLTGNHGGYLLVTGPVAADNQFLVRKYFLQILAGVSNADVVLDPQGSIVPGVIQRVPFHITADDHAVDVILLCDTMKYVVFALEAPTGEIIVPSQSSPGIMQYIQKDGYGFYRLRLPTLFTERVAHGGRWHALFASVFGRNIRQSTTFAAAMPSAFSEATGAVAEQQLIRDMLLAPRPPEIDQRAMPALPRNVTRPPQSDNDDIARGPALPYSLLVHVYSDLKLRAALYQGSYEPGATVLIEARLSRIGMPFDGTASIVAEVTPPSGPSFELGLRPDEEGRFSNEFDAFQVGVHRVRILAHGRAANNLRFTRERTLTAAIALGGDDDVSPPRGTGTDSKPHDTRTQCCEALLCMLNKGMISKRMMAALKATGIDLDVAIRCLREYCAEGGREPGGADPVSFQFDEIIGILRGIAARGDS